MIFKLKLIMIRIQYFVKNIYWRLKGSKKMAAILDAESMRDTIIQYLKTNESPLQLNLSCDADAVHFMKPAFSGLRFEIGDAVERIHIISDDSILKQKIEYWINTK